LRRTYNHRVRQDLLELKGCLDELPPERKVLLGFAAIRAGLIRGPGWLKILLALIGWRHGAGSAKYAVVIARSAPRFGSELWNRLMNHMTDGKDPHDTMSAGGWNKQSLDLFLELAGHLCEQPL
jgi:hypothetical protein